MYGSMKALLLELANLSRPLSAGRAWAASRAALSNAHHFCFLLARMVGLELGDGSRASHFGSCRARMMTAPHFRQESAMRLSSSSSMQPKSMHI